MDLPKAIIYLIPMSRSGLSSPDEFFYLFTVLSFVLVMMQLRSEKSQDDRHLGCGR